MYPLADNLTYGASPEDVKVPTKEDPSLLEVSIYEVPLSTAQSSSGSAGHEYELTRSTYAVPNMYEYATLGPNGAMVIHFVFDIYGSCSISTCKGCFQTLREI